MVSTYRLEELLRQWMNEELTPDQAIGHFLQHLIALERKQLQIERCLETMMAEIPVVSMEARQPAAALTSHKARKGAG